MAVLSKAARWTISGCVGFTNGASVAGFIRHWSDDGKWHGDRCGCVDDRCIGYHHDDPEDCGCLESWIDEYLRAVRFANGETVTCVRFDCEAAASDGSLCDAHRVVPA